MMNFAFWIFEKIQYSGILTAALLYIFREFLIFSSYFPPVHFAQYLYFVVHFSPSFPKCQLFCVCVCVSISKSILAFVHFSNFPCKEECGRANSFPFLRNYLSFNLLDFKYPLKFDLVWPLFMYFPVFIYFWISNIPIFIILIEFDFIRHLNFINILDFIYPTCQISLIYFPFFCLHVPRINNPFMALPDTSLFLLPFALFLRSFKHLSSVNLPCWFIHMKATFSPEVFYFLCNL